MNEAGYENIIFEYLPVKELDQLLQRFYSAARTKEGKEYSKSALVGMSAAPISDNSTDLAKYKSHER